MSARIPWNILMAFIALALAGCGSGSSSNSASTAPTQTPSVAMGTVTGFGSVFVNGVEWETDGATVDVDDQPGSETDLKVGHIVVVHGTSSSDGTASASSIEHDAEVEGTITSIGVDTFVVSGLTLTVDADTIFDDSLAIGSLEGLAIGDYVEVSALPTADGYLATRVDVEVDDGEIEVSGQVASLDTMNSTFMIYELVVDYSSAVFEDFGANTLANDDPVEVHGNGFGANGELLATIVEYEDHHFGSDGDGFEIEGIITTVNADGSFVVNGLIITLGPNVTFEHGTANDVVVDAKVEVEGTLDAGSLVAHEVEFKLESTIKVEAPVQSVDPIARTVTVLGIVFNVSDTTQFDDHSALDVRLFDLGDIMDGEWVEIRAYVDDATGDVIATRVERDDAEDEVELEGPVDSVNGSQVVILGVTVTTDAMTQLDEASPFASVADLLGAVDDLLVASEPVIVEVDGIQSDTAAITASEIEIED